VSTEVADLLTCRPADSLFGNSKKLLLTLTCWIAFDLTQGGAEPHVLL
jgi:hypothetical protein